MVFRLASLHAGLELEAGTSPPVLRPAAGLESPMVRHLAGEADARVDVIRNYVRFHGPARARDVAAFLDAPVRDVKAHWPDDVVEVVVDEDAAGGGRSPRFVLADDYDALATSVDQPTPVVRLLGPYDPYLQLRDRELLVPDPTRRKQLWPVLGRPGAIVAGGEIVGDLAAACLRTQAHRPYPVVAAPVGADPAARRGAGRAPQRPPTRHPRRRG